MTQMLEYRMISPYELRRVPPYWEHPRNEKGRYIPEFDLNLEHLDPPASDPEADGLLIYHESPPNSWYQLYENTTEGTPVSPAFATKQQLVDFIVEHGDERSQKMKFDLIGHDEATDWINALERKYPPTDIFAPRDGMPYWANEYAGQPPVEERQYIDNLESIRAIGGRHTAWKDYGGYETDWQESLLQDIHGERGGMEYVPPPRITPEDEKSIEFFKKMGFDIDKTGDDVHPGITRPGYGDTIFDHPARPPMSDAGGEITRKYDAGSASDREITRQKDMETTERLLGWLDTDGG